MKICSKIINLYFATHKNCNLNCRYCYIPQYNKRQKSDDDEIILNSFSNLVKKIETAGYSIGSFCLHGAEPTLMMPQSIAKIILKMNKHWTSAGISNNKVTIQSNGVNLTKEYLSIIKDNIESPADFKIGFSIDAPENIHNYLRNNSYKKVYDNFLNAIEMGFPVSILSVVSKFQLENLEALKIWLNEQLELKKEKKNPYRIKLKFATGEFALDNEQMKRFAIFLIENNFINLTQILSHKYCLQNGNNCFWLEFDIDGNCYSCNKNYYDEGIFANWKNETIEEIIEKRKQLFQNVIQHDDCYKCTYECICNSGCPSDRQTEGKNAGKALECELIKYIYDNIGNRGINIIEFFNMK